MRSVILALSLLLLTVGCDGNVRVEMPDSGMDGMVVDIDSSTEDAGMDAEVDASIEDAGMDATVEDGGTDGSVVDAGSDSGLDDGGMDVDASMDAGMDSGPVEVCGNYIIEGTEECDNGPGQSSECHADCTLRNWYRLESFFGTTAPNCSNGSMVYDGVSPTLTQVFSEYGCPTGFPTTPTMTYAGNGVFNCGSQPIHFLGCVTDGSMPAGSGWKEFQ